MHFGRIIGDSIVEIPLIGSVMRRIQESLRKSKKRRRIQQNASIANPVKLRRGKKLSVSEWIDLRCQTTRPIDVFPIPDQGPRVTLVTDQVNSSMMFGGVGTSILTAVLIANRMKAPLRLLTRSEVPDARAIHTVLNANQIKLDCPLEVVYCPYRGGRDLPVSRQDYFISTSWWTTRSLLANVRHDQIVYLMQEDERMFYPRGDDRLDCEQTMCEDELFVVVNSELLYDHLTKGPDRIPGLADRSVWFEPAFPGPTESRERPMPVIGGKRKLFFYARPNHSRNLFRTGVAALASVMAAGEFSPEKWDIHFVGQDLPDLVFPNNIRPRMIEGLSWSDYQSLVRSMDAGFVLMDTPHPSYPPLDLAAAGAMVLTNSQGNKLSLSRYSNNILVTEPSLHALTRALAHLAREAQNDALREANRKDDRICRCWQTALQSTVENVSQYFQGKAVRPQPNILPMLRSA